MRNAAEVRAAESVEVLFGFFISLNVKETLIQSRIEDHRPTVSSDVGGRQGGTARLFSASLSNASPQLPKGDVMTSHVEQESYVRMAGRDGIESFDGQTRQR